MNLFRQWRDDRARHGSLLLLEAVMIACCAMFLEAGHVAAADGKQVLREAQDDNS
jgi:hypothetical protein